LLVTSPSPLPSGGPLYCSLKCSKFSYIGSFLLHYMLQIYYARPPCSYSYMPHQIPLEKHGKNAPQNMRKGQKLQAAPSNPWIKSFPQASKILVFIVFRLNKRSLTYPEDLSSFWDQIPLQMAKISSKNHFLVIISGKIIKN
jgi:hypothetical protein